MNRAQTKYRTSSGLPDVKLKFHACQPAVSAAEPFLTRTRMHRLIIGFLLLSISAFAQKPGFTVGWSIYAGWTPYYYMQKAGLLKKWGDKYNVTIKAQRFDYAPSLDAFVAKNIDACTMTNMEALDMPAAAGVRTTVSLSAITPTATMR